MDLIVTNLNCYPNNATWNCLVIEELDSCQELRVVAFDKIDCYLYRLIKEIARTFIVREISFVIANIVKDFAKQHFISIYRYTFMVKVAKVMDLWITIDLVIVIINKY